MRDRNRAKRLEGLELEKPLFGLKMLLNPYLL